MKFDISLTCNEKRLSLIKLHSNLIYLARQHAVPICLSKLISDFGVFYILLIRYTFFTYENTRDWERSPILFPFFHLNSFQSHYKTTSSSLFHCWCARGKSQRVFDLDRNKLHMFGTKSLDIKARSNQNWYTLLLRDSGDRIWNFGIKRTHYG